MSDEMNVCPHCDSTNWHPRAGSQARGRRPTGEKSYYCEYCREEFDTFSQRETRSSGWSAARILEGIGVDPEVAMDD